MRLAYYAGASTAAAAACLLKAFHQRPNFYSATVYLSQSNACLLILTNLLLVLACSFMFSLQRLLYGPLRAIEIEQLSEKAWYAVLDTLLAMPSFREDVGGWLLTMFGLLLAGKVWGWIGEGRVDVLEQQPPANPRLFHARLATSLTLSVIFDCFMLNYCIENVLSDPRPSMMVIFTFEFAILCIFSSFTLMRYALSVFEMAVVKKQTKQAVEARKSEIRAEREAARQNSTTDDSEPTPTSPPDDGSIEVDENEVDVPGWEEKRRYLFALEVATDFLKLMIYVVFFTVSVTFNGLPMHIMRDVYMTFASFSKRVTDYVAYRKATSDMNSRYPDATTDEIRGDTCIVCRESMVAWEQPNADGEPQPAAGQPAAPRRRDEGLRAKKLPCGHILHLRCLKAWLERQQVCPTCRRPVVSAIGTEGAAQANGNPPAPAPNGHARPPRPRARMFNLGPLRVGLLNVRRGDMQNIMRQFQNAEQNGNGANEARVDGAGPQLPTANATGQHGIPTTGTGTSVSMDIQLMQIEQRIMQEAHNLGIEQQQLLNLRAMEAELARLRARHIPTQQPIGTNGAPRQAQQLNRPMNPLLPMQMPFMIPPHQQQIAMPNVETLHGSHAQQMGSQSSDLPEGLVLPEGWTVIPLRQNARHPVQDGQGHANPQAQQSHEQVSANSGATSTSASTAQQAERSAESNPTNSIPDNVRPAPTPTRPAQGNGPTDDGGSPLFIPSQPTVMGGTARSSQAVNSNSSATVSSTPEPASSGQVLSHATSDSHTTSDSPWGGDSWSFVPDPTDSHDTIGAQNNDNGHASNTSEEQKPAVDKGKGKSVEIENVSDDEEGSS